uniref:Uncharacterized protein n=1 Tax=Chromera velia CCMP2878 TaxID=1169474 RepID=A0A0G4H605_9ALVE|eukprot:Cvel_5752.t1-p1 / transcript=Cvel_5752.t1 / gene=Cvel_5752 / organism=Chromera_velia_CCMP2878 / gene_product=hypothetical protein / transcript_product=hypothetical protein / location=Cvel_scaffold273:41578-41793(+) / protein_length=72 / sequence_SO=supercontig / SO=protein_coding / is_pseudo=false
MLTLVQVRHIGFRPPAQSVDAFMKKEEIAKVRMKRENETQWDDIEEKGEEGEGGVALESLSEFPQTPFDASD